MQRDGSEGGLRKPRTASNRRDLPVLPTRSCGESAFIATTPQAIANVMGRIDPVRSSYVLLLVKIVSRLIIVIALAASSRSFAVEQPSDIPAWLRPNVGEGEGQIAQVILQRGRTLYFQKVRAGVVRNPCYFAMDATRPHELSDGKLGPRFYVIFESDRSFRAISAGHGGGRDLKGIADFANGKRCAKNFGNALDSRLTATNWCSRCCGPRCTPLAARTERIRLGPRRSFAGPFEDRCSATIQPHVRRSRVVWRLRLRLRRQTERTSV